MSQSSIQISRTAASFVVAAAVADMWSKSLVEPRTTTTTTRFHANVRHATTNATMPAKTVATFTFHHNAPSSQNWSVVCLFVEVFCFA